MSPRRALALLLVALVALAACGGTPAATPATVGAALGTAANSAATQTRAVELGQLATLTAPTPTGAPLVAATQTRAAELSQLATLTAPTAAPAAGTAPAPGALAKGNLVGRVDASEAYIGIVVTGSDVVAYVCDGANLAQWFTGTIQGSLIDLSAANGAHLTAEAQRPAGTAELQAARGTFRSAEGRNLSFATAAVGSLGRAGLYRGTGAAGGTSLTMGVIVLPDNSLRGVLRAGQFTLPVADPTFAANGLVATFAEFGPVTAQRLGA